MYPQSNIFVLYVSCDIVKNELNTIQWCAHLFEQAKEGRENPGTPSGLDDHPSEYPGDPGSYPDTPRTPTERTPRTPTENSNGEDPLNSSSGKTGHNFLRESTSKILRDYMYEPHVKIRNLGVLDVHFWCQCVQGACSSQALVWRLSILSDN